MPKLRQKFLQPGVYCVGRDAQGSRFFRDYGAADLQAYVANTNRLISAGYRPPVLLEHPKAGSDEGSPIQLSAWDQKAAELRNTVGVIDSVEMGSDGAAEYVLDIRDAEVFKQLESGAIKHTSPELRGKNRPFTDGAGNVHSNFIAHAALTHRPRNTNQSALVPVGAGDGASQFSADDVVQFSLADAVSVQFADSDGDGISNAADPPNPDLPKNQPADKQQLDAVLALAKEICGIDLPADVTEETLVRDLLTALKTAKAAKDKAAEEEAEKDKERNQDGRVTEDTLPMQFSLSDIEAETFAGPKLLKKIIQQGVNDLNRKLDGMVKAGKITPAFRDGLLSKHGSLQFSADDGEIRTSYTLPEVVELLDKTTLDGQALTVDQLSAGSTEEQHPGGTQYTHGTDERPMTEQEADAISRSVCSR